MAECGPSLPGECPKGAREHAGVLTYKSRGAERSTPVWKHPVFVPLLFWVGLFIAAAVAGMVVGLVVAIFRLG
jgi:hypothetical protein